MAARLEAYILVVLCTDLAELESGVHLNVELVLLLRHRDVLICCVGKERQVRVDVAPVRIQVAATHIINSTCLREKHIYFTVYYMICMIAWLVVNS